MRFLSFWLILLVVALVIAPSPTTSSAQGPVEGCPTFEPQITALQLRADALTADVEAFRGEMFRLEGELGVNIFAILEGSSAIEPFAANFDAVTAQKFQRLTQLVILLAEAYDDFLLVQTTLLVLDDACDAIADTNGAGTATVGSLGECIDGVMVMENTLPEGGDEIVVMLCDDGSDAAAVPAPSDAQGDFGECINGFVVYENTVGQGGDEIILVACDNPLVDDPAPADNTANPDVSPDIAGDGPVFSNIPVAPDDQLNGWRMEVNGTFYHQEIEGSGAWEQDTTIAFVLSDTGELHYATLFFYHFCEAGGNIIQTGENTYELNFKGTYGASSANIWSTTVNITLLSETLDENGHIPVSITSTSLLNRPNEPPYVDGYFVQSTETLGFLHRLNLGSYANEVCGDG